jgi:hypothetical protein
MHLFPFWRLDAKGEKLLVGPWGICKGSRKLAFSFAILLVACELMLFMFVNLVCW